MRPEITGLGKSRGDINVNSEFLAGRLSEETGKKHSPEAIDRMLTPTGIISRGGSQKERERQRLLTPLS